MTDQIDMPRLSRRELRRRDRRDAIIAVARRSFLASGYAATTMSSIAAELGGSKGTLWSYFPSKEELFAAVLRDATETYHADLLQLLDSRGELEPTLVRFGHDLIRRLTSVEAIRLHRLIAGEANRFPEIGAIFFELAPLNTRKLLARFLEGSMERGQLRRADPQLAARMLIVLTLSGCHQQMIWGSTNPPKPEQIDADVAFAVDCFLRAYAPEAGKPAPSSSH
ncbi:Transcriptional regulator [Sphingobium herbicidovorans NBRC 16415]|uniref:Transcriptional regulator n=1 Tax=Sphingobium herbicidovorans (strain ATCC 700291 / DSM 11019 / CCUG 56400 / KCTC 2939 / LMG 18315 / NBRC 16415 / MH) TaxID=1219045 RepID=A0A086PB64_SPHHM|nr:TetR/AcrR family transcriptional regulator [Sphingobium herbicidovorans]KFG90632.1 Transcriptional regulator [Sphingobium herbicidovorans NBRC 16415]